MKRVSANKSGRPMTLRTIYQKTRVAARIRAANDTLRKRLTLDCAKRLSAERDFPAPKKKTQAALFGALNGARNINVLSGDPFKDTVGICCLASTFLGTWGTVRYCRSQGLPL